MSASTVLLQPQNPALKPGTCFHCHEACPPEAAGTHLRIGDKQFCCNGCKMVYEILSAHDLCDFYTLDDQAGRTLRNQRSAHAYAYLDASANLRATKRSISALGVVCTVNWLARTDIAHDSNWAVTTLCTYILCDPS